MEELKPIVGAGEATDIGQAMQALIRDNLARLNVAFLAVVQEVKGNKLIVNQVIKSAENKTLAIPSILVGIPQTTSFKQAMKVKAGDYGLCIVCDNDISGYKQSGDKSEKMSNRTHDLIDSIFIPLSLYNSVIDQNSIESEIDFSIATKAKLIMQSEDSASLTSKAEITIGSDKSLSINAKEDLSLSAKGDSELVGKLLTIKSQNASLKSMLEELSDTISAIATTGGYTVDPTSQAKLLAWKQKLAQLFKG